MRKADDGSTRSFTIRTEMGRKTLRNSRHLKFQHLSPKRVSFADTAETGDSDSAGDDTAARSTETDEAAVAALRASARLAARNDRQPYLRQLGLSLLRRQT